MLAASVGDTYNSWAIYEFCCTASSSGIPDQAERAPDTWETLVV